MNAHEVDVAVVGAGIVGCLVASRITELRPHDSVTVLDKDAVGSGASRRSAGVHFPRGATPRVRAMADYSARHYERLRSDHPSLPIYPVPMEVCTADPAGARIRRTYLPGARLTRNPIAGNHLAAWSGVGGHYADVAAVAAAVSTSLRPRVRFREAVGVRSVEPDGDGITIGLTTGDALRARAAVLAPGPWIDAPPWRALIAALGMRVKKVVALHVDGRPEAGAPLTVFDDDDSFLLPVRHRGHWLFSYTCNEWDVDPDDLSGGLSASDLAPARETLARHAPALVERITGGRVFCDAFSVDREPVVRYVGPTDRLVFAGAASGSGYRLAPAIAAEAADLIAAGLRVRSAS